MSRQVITFVLLILMAVAGPAGAQTSSSVPAPPPPGSVSAPALEGPTTNLEAIPADVPAARSQAVRDDDLAVTSHDALQARGSAPRGERVYAPRQPPPAVTERPSGRRPELRAQWISGYWDWDPARSEFFWMGGLWQVPPPDSIWVAGRWVRDQNGWYRASGFWSRRRGQVVVATGHDEMVEPAWRTTGPPADHPADQPTDAPGPDYFFIPGHYAPEGDQVAWKAGFWARSHPGWDWIPARWVRRTAGWEFRPGHWVLEPDAPAVDIRITGRSTGRAPTGESVMPPAPPPGAEDEIDPIAEAEARGRRDPGTIVVVPRNRMPYYVIRPPGSYPYGPGGVIVPGVVPGFVRNILDQVLP